MAQENNSNDEQPGATSFHQEVLLFSWWLWVFVQNFSSVPNESLAASDVTALFVGVKAPPANEVLF